METEVITMIKFERVGVNFQYEATSIEQANKSFKYSCECCCNKGIRLDCDRCAIAHAHNLVVAYFDDNNVSEVNTKTEV
jgi:hypothetical protein